MKIKRTLHIHGKQGWGFNKQITGSILYMKGENAGKQTIEYQMD